MTGQIMVADRQPILPRRPVQWLLRQSSVYLAAASIAGVGSLIVAGWIASPERGSGAMLPGLLAGMVIVFLCGPMATVWRRRLAEARARHEPDR